MRAVVTILLLAAMSSRAQMPEFRLFGSTGSEARYTPENLNSPLNPGGFLNIPRRGDSSDMTLFGDLVPESKRWKLHMKLRGSNDVSRIATSHFEVSELSLTYSVKPWLELRGGRSIERWGTGYAWNPTGVVNPRKNPNDPTDRRNAFRGVDNIGVNLFAGGWSVTMLAVPDLNWGGRTGRRLQGTGWAGRAYRLVKGFDLAFTASGGGSLPNTTGWSVAKVFGDALELHAEAAYYRDTTRAYPADSGFVPAQRKHMQFLFGGQYTFPKNVNIIAEYFHTGAGLSGLEWDRFRTSARDYPAQTIGYYAPLTMSKNYLFTRTLWPIRLNKLEAEVVTISSLRDGSSIVRPGVYWKVRPNWSLYVLQSEFTGARTSETGHAPIKRSTEIGLRYHFSFDRK